MSKHDNKFLFVQPIILIGVFCSSLWIFSSEQFVGILVSDTSDLFIDVGAVRTWLFALSSPSLIYVLFSQLKTRSESDVNSSLEAIVNRINESIFLKDKQGRYTFINASAAKLLGKKASEIISNYDVSLFPALEAQKIQEIEQEIIKEGKTLKLEETVSIVSLAGLAYRVTQQKQQQKQLEKAFNYDSNFHILNREGLKSQLEKSLNPEENASNFVLLHLSLLKIKKIKYSIGQETANNFLRKIIKELKALLPEDTLLAKIDGDDLGIALFIETEETGKKWAKEIENLFNSSFRVDKHRLYIDVKIGLVFSQYFEGSAEECLQAADMAMNYAKSSVKDNCVIFEPKMREDAIAQLEMDRDLREGLSQEEFYLNYQPIVNLNNQQIEGFEALLRWSKNGQKIYPNDFIPVAEETGFIVVLGDWVLYQACRQIQIWNSYFKDSSNLYISVNVSPIQILRPGFLKFVDRVLNHTKISPKSLRIELTETALAEDFEKLKFALKQLKNREIGLYLDDFGTGYSSFGYLQELPFDVMKIDRIFVNNIVTDPKAFKLIQALISLAENLEMEMVIEGIETQEQQEKLKQLKCPIGQGYLFARPLSPEDIEIILSNGKI